jgi:hypothetical protein
MKNKSTGSVRAARKRKALRNENPVKSRLKRFELQQWADAKELAKYL